MLSLAQSATAAFFIEGPADWAGHDLRMCCIFKGVQAEPTDHAIGQRSALSPQMQPAGNDGEKNHQPDRAE